jgi:hypothetical protein
MARRSNGSISILSSHFITIKGFCLTEKDLQLVLNALRTSITLIEGVRRKVVRQSTAHASFFYSFQKHYRITWMTFPVSFKQVSKWTVKTLWRNNHSNEMVGNSINCDSVLPQNKCFCNTYDVAWPCLGVPNSGRIALSAVHVGDRNRVARKLEFVQLLVTLTYLHRILYG